jgi:hypothetical protein
MKNPLAWLFGKPEPEPGLWKIGPCDKTEPPPRAEYRHLLIQTRQAHAECSGPTPEAEAG